MAKKAKRRKVSSKRNRQNHENKNRGSSGGGYSVIDWGKFKDKPDFFKLAKGKNKFDIIPFEVKSKNHPDVRRKEINIGDLDIYLDVWVHRNIGPGKAQVTCLSKNYGKSCPICEKQKEAYAADDEKTANALKASRRSIFNVLVPGSESLQVLETSYACFTKLLVEEANECSEGDDIINYADIEDGMTIKARMVEEKIGKNSTYLDAERIDFEDRDEELEDELIDEAFSFDEGLKVLTAEEMERMLYGADESDDDDEDEDDEEEEAPSRKRKKRKPEPEEEDEDDDEEEEEEPPKKRRKRKPKPEPEEEDDDEDEEEEAPKKSSKKSSKKSTKKGKQPKCFGECDEHDACDSCKVWDDCMDATD